jgi:hypothetical protein
MKDPPSSLSNIFNTLSVTSTSPPGKTGCAARPSPPPTTLSESGSGVEVDVEVDAVGKGAWVARVREMNLGVRESCSHSNKVTVYVLAHSIGSLG